MQGENTVPHPSDQFDLGSDRTRIKDHRDARRQSATVAAILRRFFGATPEACREVQVLADEVGMGKTYVALGIAYSILEAMAKENGGSSLDSCYRKILILTPQNSALYTKWTSETREFVSRCVKPEHRALAHEWFAPVKVERFDDLVRVLRDGNVASCVLAAKTSIFGGGFRHEEVKLPWLMGLLFRHWGTRFRKDSRQRLLGATPSGWPHTLASLERLGRKKQSFLPCGDKQALHEIGRLDENIHEGLLRAFRALAKPYVRDRGTGFARSLGELRALYRALCAGLIEKNLPLVIVDEAHNWKNGPSHGANGFYRFRDDVACRTKRVLLLTATPFQLHPNEMLELLRISDNLAPGDTPRAAEQRREWLKDYREKRLRPALRSAREAGQAFSRAWGRLPYHPETDVLESIWRRPELQHLRASLVPSAGSPSIPAGGESDKAIDRAVAHVDPSLRQFFREALRLYVANACYSSEIGQFVIRHRRGTEHRLFKVGEEFSLPDESVRRRPDRHLLHGATGFDVRGDAELPHFLLMRCVSEMKWLENKGGRSSLGSDLTGCWSTLSTSAEGARVKKALENAGDGQRYLGLLTTMVDRENDPDHPKVKAVADAVLEAWNRGEKSLIFCFRTNTAGRLRDIIRDRVTAALERRRRRLGDKGLKLLRTRLTGRDRDLLPIGLDRVLWSFRWAWRESGAAGAWPKLDLLRVQERDLEAVARFGERFGMEVTKARPDRVFLHRALESAIARRLLEARPPAQWVPLLEAVAHEDWVSNPYGLASTSTVDDDADGEKFATDERGVHTRYVPRPLDEGRASQLVTMLRAHHRRAGGNAILDSLACGPNLWLGPDPSRLARLDEKHAGLDTARSVERLRRLHGFLARLSMRDDGSFDWESRGKVLQALRRATLRESVLLRLLKRATEVEDEGWSMSLVDSFFRNLPGQHEAMADRIVVFLEDLASASGSLEDPLTARFAIFDASHARDKSFVVLVDGSTGAEQRNRFFSGFNTPLLPEVLICTSVGQEGIDLHRHCRHVVHYDLAWNPAVLEQRTGRTDRIGSKTFRERARATDPIQGPFLEIGVPFLAGTYDERMFEELRLRAQMFEVLTGGDFSVQRNAEGNDDGADSDGETAGLSYVLLPEEMVADLRVKLHVWSEGN